jgi:hypothetical protein
MAKADTPAKPIPANWNRVGYIAFTIAGILFAFWGSDRTQGPMFLALALVFEPYDQSVPWQERPRWVKLLLIGHLGLAAALLGYVMAR